MSTGADTLMTIGRWKGCLYKEIPHDYGRWAVKETERTANSSPELIMYARWWRDNKQDIPRRRPSRRAPATWRTRHRRAERQRRQRDLGNR